MNQIVRFQAKSGRAFLVGRTQGQAQGLLDAADNLDRLSEYTEHESAKPHLDEMVRSFRVRAEDLLAESEAILGEATAPWWRRALSALRRRW